MQEYKVIALSVGGLGNKVFESGDIVTENNFVEGRAEQLVEQGFLIPYAAKEAEEKDAKEAEEKDAKEAEEKDAKEAEEKDAKEAEEKAAKGKKGK